VPRIWVVTLIVFCTVLNGAGFAWNLFEPVPLYDEVAHLLTPLVLVAIAAEIVYGLVGATAWEGIEILMDLMGIHIDHALPDTFFDIFLGILGGALGAWVADRYLDRLFERSRTNPHRRRVR
jgi:hypothetical protein